MQRALYISPVLPFRHGVGLAQRAYRLIEALSHRYRVTLLAAPHADREHAAASDTAAMCDDVIVLRPGGRWTADTLAPRALRRCLPSAYYACYRRPSDWRLPTRANRRQLEELCGRERFDLIFVHRLYMLPFLRSMPALAHVPACVDLDDIESLTRDRIAGLARRNGDRKLADLMERDAGAYRVMERRELGRVGTVIVCSETDRARLGAGGGPPRVGVLPNVVDVPEPAARAHRGTDERFVFLFVGTLDYYPNRDAVAFLCREIVPLIRTRASRPFAIRIVTQSGLETRRQVPAIPELSWAPRDADLAREYTSADAAIVPIRAGGGTRIKALEAFAHRTAVISTALGVEGLDVVQGEHALIGDTAADLAAHARTVMEDAPLRRRLTERALALVQTAYSPAALRRRVEGLLNPARPGTAAGA